MPHKILLVDDEKDIRTVLRLALEQAGYQVEEAGDGLTALGKLQVWQFDAVLLDLGMPRLDGTSALDTLRHLRREPVIPVIVITAQDDEETRRRVAEAGASGFLSKPVDTTQLRALLGDLLAGTPNSMLHS